MSGELGIHVVTAAGQQLVLPIRIAGKDFVYSGRLFALNHQLSEVAGKQVYSEITPAAIADIREHASRVLEMTDHWEAQLALLCAKNLPAQ